MAFKLKWPLSKKEKEPKKGPKSVNIFLGFFFMVNYCLGTGFLGVPFSFFYAGYLASIPTLLLVAFVSWNNAEWEIETMARAQAIDTWRREKKRLSGLLQSESESEREILIRDTPEESRDTKGADSKTLLGPRYEIRCKRKFEPIELCEIFLTQWGKYAYMIVWTLNCFLSGWSFTTVAASAWSTNIPFSGSTVQQCTGEDFLRVLIPQNQQCWNAYMICVLLFAVIVVPLSLLDLSEQALLHTTLGLLRFITIAIIVLYCVVKLSIATNECSYTVDQNTSLPLSHNTSEFDFTSDNTSIVPVIKYGFSDLSKIVFRFDVKGWLISIPVLTFALMLHQGIPALTHPIKEKHLLRQFMVAMYGIATISYLSLGVVVPLWFKANIQETCTLNWVPLLSSPNPALQILSYYLILFPSVDVISAYPLLIHAISNNIFMIICGRDTSRKSKHPTRDCVLQYIIKFLSATLPIAAALFISNLVYVLKYAGITGFFICFLFPTALQLRSIWVCSEEFSETDTITVEMEKIGRAPLLKKKDGESVKSEDGVRSEDGGGEEERETSQGRDRGKWLKKISCYKQRLMKMFSSYQTPYSSRFLSHPVVVCVFGGVGVVLFLLGVASLGVHPEPIFCRDQD